MNQIERNKAIYECHKKGLYQKEIGEIFKLTQSAVSYIIKDVKNGNNELKGETRGGKPKLNLEQKSKLKKLLCDPPKKHDFKVWDKHLCLPRVSGSN